MSEAHRPRRTLRRIGAVLTGLLAVVVILYLGLYIVADRALNKTDSDAKQKTVTSKDGTLIAFEQTGVGPVVIVVTGALADRTGTRPLARHLVEHFTVINYDRRGRGTSTDAQPYAVAREVEDIEALIDATGGSAFVFGVSSGAVLALEAASELGGKSRSCSCMSRRSSSTAAVRQCRMILAISSPSLCREAAGALRSRSSSQKVWAFRPLQSP